MSLFQSVNLVCPSCDKLIVMDAVGSVNADRRPDFRDDILNDDFQEMTCDACDKTFRLQPDFSYLDVGHGQWIASKPAAYLSNYLEIEDDVSTLFEQSYGAKAPAAARSVGDDLTVRLTFGWPAIREKLLAGEHELDDVVLEMLKLDLLRRMPSAPLGPGTELRLVDVGQDRLGFVWIDTATEETDGEVVVDKQLYNDIAGAPEAWAPIRAQLTNGAFVDMQKLYMGEGRVA